MWQHTRIHSTTQHGKNLQCLLLVILPNLSSDYEDFEQCQDRRHIRPTEKKVNYSQTGLAQIEFMDSKPSQKQSQQYSTCGILLDRIVLHNKKHLLFLR